MMVSLLWLPPNRLYEDTPAYDDSGRPKVRFRELPGDILINR